MAGRISERDIEQVRQRVRIDEIVAEYVQLKHAGSGSYKGLCPFHDEKTPSFQVTPSRGLYYCFGCGEGGDAIRFLEKIENLTFVEAVQNLADKVGVELHIEQDDTTAIPSGLRQQILAANQAAAQFYAEQITTPEALIFRQFVDGRGFDRQAAEDFLMGYAPKDGKSLGQHLRGRGFSYDVLVAAGLIRQNGWDYFQGRVIWPIRDTTRSVLGFGARRVYDDDRLPAKYLNTPETPVYKKSHVLYGLDHARQAIGKTNQVVVVEGYTDVMACHLAGIPTAVASCGTAFGEDHARIVHRLMGSHDAFHGEVIFTFDGDEAGQKAAMKVYDLDSNFVSQTYVAVDREGRDPCDIRLAGGDRALRDLIAQRIPLYSFVMGNIVNRYDLNRADGRLKAVRQAAPLLESVRDRSLARAYIHDLSRQVGMDIEETRQIVAASLRRRPDDRYKTPVHENDKGFEDALDGLDLPWPDPHDRNLAVERGTLKLIVQCPTLFDRAWNGLAAVDFTHPTYRKLFETVIKLDADVASREWSQQLHGACESETVRQLLIALLVEPFVKEPDIAYADAHSAKLQLLTTLRDLTEMKSRLQRINPATHPEEHRKMFEAFVLMEQQRQRLEAQGLKSWD